MGSITIKRAVDLIKRKAEAMTGKASGGIQEIEKRLVEDYRTELFNLIEKLGESDSEHVQNTLKQKLSIYQKQLSSYKVQFPDDPDLDWYEACVYVVGAYQKLGSTGFAHKAIDRTDSIGAKLVYASLAKSQNDSNAREAVRLLARAIQLDDNPGVRMLRASVLSSLKEKQAALHDVNYVLEHFSDDQDLYLDARKLKDEIEQEEDKKCFIATAVYGSADAEEVLVLRQFRDQVLLQSDFGRKFVAFYYGFSPSVAHRLSNTRLLRRIAKTWLLAPLVWMVAHHPAVQSSFTRKQID